MVKEKDKIVEFLKKNKVDLTFLSGAILVGIFLGWNNMEVLIFTVFVGIILRPVSSRYLAIPALFFLVLAVFMMILGNVKRADEFAIYVYYFLIMAVVMGVYEIRMEEKRVKN
ncbi:hypothetical protein ACFL08_01460 [Patescibacteria group bacterium]